jgi:hypothetical protein
MIVKSTLNSVELFPENDKEFEILRAWLYGREPVTLTAVEKVSPDVGTTKTFSPTKPMTFADFLEMKTESLPKNE